MKKLFFLLIPVLLFSRCQKSVYQREEVIVTGTDQPVISLDGVWKFNMSPPEDFYNTETGDSDWFDILVPGEPAMQGFAIKHNSPFAYRNEILIPPDYLGKRIKLRFGGVYSYARLWINGTLIRDHTGGFTEWEADITDHVDPGKKATVALEVTDADNDLSYGSGYAKHQIGGILRSVSLIALPENSPEDIFISTNLDHRRRVAKLNIRLISPVNERTWVGFRLYDPKGNQVRLNDKRYLLKRDTFDISFPVKNTELWDAEHPNLYTLFVEVFDRSIRTASFQYRFGFRKTEIIDNRLYVNGREVKLRGICRHDIHPLLGRVSTMEYDLKDVLLAKEANINFIRTSHYPPSESFLRYCDEYGIYVEDESAVCFVDTHRSGQYKNNKQSGPGFIPQQLLQIEEMVKNHYNHPSVIIWSLGNESIYNEGFRLGYDYIKSIDRSRPVIFSYPGTVPDSVACYDILSMHYPSFQGNLEQYGISVSAFKYDRMPAIYDEWAHVSCYNKPELLTDMNVRNFWGESIDRMWSEVFESDGGAGGAIWGLTDETFMLPDNTEGRNEWWGMEESTNGISMYEGPVVGYGEWGITDTWRRKKPEFWNTKKAYSPVEITIGEITDFKAGGILYIPVYNRFNHTNLREIRPEWRYRGKTSIARFRNIGPGEKGELLLPPVQWQEGEIINLRFYQNDTVLVDEYNLRLGTEKHELPSLQLSDIEITENNSDEFSFEGISFSATVSKKTGLLENIVSNGDTIIKSGPYLHFRYPEYDHWSVAPITELSDRWVPGEMNLDTESGYVHLISSGTYGRIKVILDMKIDRNGTIFIDYKVDGLSEKYAIEELGLKFILGTEPDTLKWYRNSLWNAYPPEHIGMTRGVADISKVNNNAYRQQPAGIWEYDNKSFYYNGLTSSGNLSYLVSSMKENIYEYTLVCPGASELNVVSAGDNGCRLNRDMSDELFLYINSLWDYNSLKWGNYTKNLKTEPTFQDRLCMTITL